MAAEQEYKVKFQGREPSSLTQRAKDGCQPRLHAQTCKQDGRPNALGELKHR